MDVDLVYFEPQKASRQEWDRLHRFRRLRHQERDPGDPILSDEAVESMMRRPDPHWDTIRLIAINPQDVEEQVGALDYHFVKENSPDYEENKHLAYMYAEVLPAHRRQGIGSRLLSEAVRLSRENGRSLLIMGSDEAVGKNALEAIGWKVAQRFRESRLYLDRMDWRMVERWGEAGPQRSPETKLRFFTNRIPDDVIEELADALTEFFNQMPRDDLQRGDEVITPQALREWEARIQDGKGARLSAVTFEDDGTISGLTEMGYFPDEEYLIHQYMTGVRQPYRGRGLGKWLKAVMLLRVREEFPQVKVVSTGNATSNAPMLSINQRLGFKPYREGAAYQVSVDDLEEYLRSRGP